MNNKDKLYNYTFKGIYDLYVKKVERKERTKEELNKVIAWLTGYGENNLENIESDITLKEFFKNAPNMNPNANLIKGIICGCRVEEIEDPLTQKIRWMDKIVDELAKGKKIEKILR
ncbi:MAG: DUF2200 domain-containing protein [Defluviitaleaceae bacterium]|nr:DUF2200 domain-containing protein [Defluviitaleaceae bacterium]